MQGGKRTDAESLAEQRPFVEALARRLVLDPNSADDVVQETLLAAMKSAPKRSVRGWLARVVRNLAYRTRRSEELSMDPGVLCPNAGLEAIACRAPAKRDELFELTELKRWFVREFGAEVTRAIQPDKQS